MGSFLCPSVYIMYKSICLAVLRYIACISLCAVRIEPMSKWVWCTDAGKWDGATRGSRLTHATQSLAPSVYFFSGRSYSTVITREFWKKIHATIRSTEPVKKEKSYQNNIIIAPEPNVEGRIRCYRHPTKVDTEIIRISVNTLLLY